MKSLCEALEHIRVVQSGPECEMCEENYYFMNTRGAHWMDFGRHSSTGLTTVPRGTSVFPKENLGLQELARKSSKR